MKTMQKLMLLLITLSMVVGMLTVPVAAASTTQDWVAVNGPHAFAFDEEHGFGKASANTLSVVADPDNANNAVLQSVSTGTARIIPPNYTLTPEAGKSYKMTAKIKAASGTPYVNFSTGSKVYANVVEKRYINGVLATERTRALKASGGYLDNSTTYQVTADTTWKTYEFILEVTDADTTKAGTNWFISHPSGTTIYVDDVTISELQTVNQYDVTVSASAGGSVKLNGADAASAVVKEGEDVVVAVAPEAGYEVDTVTVNGEAVELTDNTYTIENIAADTAIAVDFKVKEVAQSTVTVVAGENGSVLIDGEAIAEKTVADGTEVVLTVTANDGYEATVTVNGEAAALVGNTLTLTVDKDMAVAVSFALPKEWVGIGSFADNGNGADVNTLWSVGSGASGTYVAESGNAGNNVLEFKQTSTGAANRITTRNLIKFEAGKKYKISARVKAASGTTSLKFAGGAKWYLNYTRSGYIGDTIASAESYREKATAGEYPGVTIDSAATTDWQTVSAIIDVATVGTSHPAAGVSVYLEFGAAGTYYIDDFNVYEFKTPTYYDVTVSANELGSVLYNNEVAPATISAKEASDITLELVPASDKYQVDTVTVDGAKVDPVDNKITLSNIQAAKNVVVTFSRLKYWKTVVSYDGADYENWYYENSEDDTHTKHSFSAVDVITEGDNQVLVYESPYSTMRVGELDLFKFESGKKYKVSFKVKFDTEEDAFDLTMMSNSRMFMLYDKYGMIDDEIAVAKVVDRDKYDDGEFINVAFKSLTPGEWATYSFVIDATSVNPAGSYGGKEYTDETEFFIRSSVEGTFYVDGFTFEVEEDVPDEPVVEYVDVTVAVGENGSVLYDGVAAPETITVEKGSDVELTVAPATGYKAIVTIDGVEVPSEDGIIVLEALQANAAVAVSFEEIVKEASISEGTVTPDADYAEGYSILAYFKALVPVSQTLKEMGANFTIGEDTFKLKAEAYTNDYQFGIRVFGDDVNAEGDYGFEGYIEVE